MMKKSQNLNENNAIIYSIQLVYYNFYNIINKNMLYFNEIYKINFQFCILIYQNLNNNQYYLPILNRKIEYFLIMQSYRKNYQIQRKKKKI